MFIKYMTQHILENDVRHPWLRVGLPVGLAWWRHQMETFSALLAICAGNSPVPGEFPAQRPVTRSFDVFFDLRLNKRLSIQSWGWWIEMLSHPLWTHRNDTKLSFTSIILSIVKQEVSTELNRKRYDFDTWKTFWGDGPSVRGFKWQQRVP